MIIEEINFWEEYLNDITRYHSRVENKMKQMLFTP